MLGERHKYKGWQRREGGRAGGPLLCGILGCRAERRKCYLQAAGSYAAAASTWEGERIKPSNLAAGVLSAVLSSHIHTGIRATRLLED